MGKKYTPSGYQIINLGSYSDGDGLITDAPLGYEDDAKLLFEILKKGSFIEKPVLIHVLEGNNVHFCGLATGKDDDGMRDLSLTVQGTDGYHTILIHLEDIDSTDATVKIEFHE